MMRPHAPRPGCPRRVRAFTLIELLVSMTVLSIIVLLISQLFSSATNVATSGRKRLDADAQARLVFDRLALDLGKMVKRNDVDYLFAKVTGTSNTDGRNDAMFFYSEAPAFFDTASAASDLRSPVALVGYRINQAYQLERLGKQLAWDESASSTPGAITYLAPVGVPKSTPTDSNILDVNSTLAGHWQDVIGKASDVPAYTGGTDYADYQILAEQVCRFEFCFQLKDGSYSPNPVCPLPIASLPLLPNNSPPTASIHYDTQGPKMTNDSGGGYVVGYRWYDTNANRGYVCTDSTGSAAIWKPLGMQDVRAVVVALGILDASSASYLRTVPVTVGSRPSYNAPKLDTLASLLADANPSDVIPPGNGSGAGTTVPSFSTPPPTGTPVPARLMGEAWTNETRLTNFAQISNMPGPAAAQVRVYQRSFVLNNQ